MAKKCIFGYRHRDLFCDYNATEFFPSIPKSEGLFRKIYFGRMWGLPDYIDYNLGPVDGSMCDTLGIDASVAPDYSENSVKVFPNPTTGKIDIRMVEQKVAIFNLLGEQVEVLFSDQNGNIVFPNNIPDGIYIFQFIFDETPGRKQYSKVQLIRN